MLIKKNVGWILVVAIALTPLIPWYFSLSPFYYRFSNAYSTLTSLGDIASLTGFTLYAITLVLSTRMELFEDYFGGMNRVYIAHHIYGSVALLLLLLHPLLLASARYTLSAKSAAIFLLPGNDWSINFGIAGLLLMMSLLILTLFVSLPYHIWRFTHKFLGAVFIIASIHGFFVASDISRSPLLMWYMLFIVVLGTIAYLYRTIFGRFLVKRTEYVVSDVSNVKNNVTQIILNPKNKKIKVIAGQFLFIGFKSAGISNEVHPFSISSVSDDGQISITAKVEGDYTKSLANLKVGDTGIIEGGFGRFSYQKYSNKNQIWIAAGIGIVPFVSMALKLNDSRDYIVDLYYTVRTEDEAVYLSELTQLTQSMSNFRVFPYFTKTQGRLTADIIEKISGNLVGKDFFICGPPPMMKGMRKQLVKLKVSSKNIHTEEFSL